MAVGHLCALEFEGEAPCPHLVVLAMTAMVGHDFKHDGTSNETGKSLEAIAWQACEPYLDGVHLEDKKAIEAIILGTDPTKLNEHRARYSDASVPPSAIDRLRLIACEADLTPSLMPEHGVEMGKLLAKELKSSNVPVLTVLGERISSWESRMGFLHHATQRIGHDLVAEADAKHGHFRVVGGADKIAQRRQPGVILVDTGGRTGEDDALQSRRIG